MKKTLLISLIILSLFSCQQNKKDSSELQIPMEQETEKRLRPKELISKIEEKGYAVEKGVSISAIAQNSDVQFWLTIEGERISAYLFNSPETAEIKAEGFENGYSKGYWAFEYVSENTRKILEESLK